MLPKGIFCFLDLAVHNFADLNSLGLTG